MKKSITYRWVILIAIAIVAGFYACKKDKSIPVTIIGNWVNTSRYAKGQVYNQTYIFNADSTVQVSGTLRDSTSGTILGYQYTRNGKFRLNGDQLKLYKLITYSNLTQSPVFPQLNQLSLLKTDTVQNYTIKFKANYSTFYFYYPPCGINENCLGEMDFIRQ
ncbi:MAG: hypothetical protein ACXVAY_16005 [Mucilaginibacter sp.]